MGSTMDLSASMEILESKRYNASKAMLKLAVEWKSLDEQLDTIQKFVIEGQGSLDYEMKQTILRSEQDALFESNKKLSLGWESLKLKLEELECSEKKFRSFHLAEVEELKTREEKMEETRRWVVERVEDFEAREDRLNEQKKLMKVLLQRIEREKEEFMGIAKSVGKKLEAIKTRERHCAEQRKELDSIQDSVLGRVQELHSRAKQVMEREDKVEEIQRSNDLWCREHESNLKLRSDKLESLRGLLEQEAEELEEREKQVDLREKQIKAVPFNEKHLKDLEIKVQDQYRILDTLRDLKGKWAKDLDLGGRQVAIGKFFSLQEKVYDYIRELIGKGQHLIAIRYVALFDLGSEFPPATLLKEFVSHVEEAVEKIRKEGNFSLSAQGCKWGAENCLKAAAVLKSGMQILRSSRPYFSSAPVVAATKKEMNAIIAVRNCIRAYEINSEYTLVSLEDRIERLEKQRTDLELSVPSPPTDTRSHASSTFQTREVHAKKRKRFLVERDNQALSANMLSYTTVPHQHLPLFPIQVSQYRMPPRCLVGSTPDPLILGKCGEFFPYGHEPGTQIEFSSLRWSSAWP